MLHRALRLTSFLCCTLVLIAFAVFANDQLAGASAHQASELASGTAIATTADTAVRPHGQPWRFVDDAASRLTAPFGSIVHSHNVWAEHGLAAVFGLLVYGLALGWVARFSRGRA